MSSKSLRVTVVSTPNGIKTRKVESHNGRVVCDQTSMSPNRSSSASRNASVLSFLSPSSSSISRNSPLSYLFSTSPLNHYMGPICAAHNDSSHMVPNISILSPYSHMPMSRVFNQPATKKTKSKSKVQAAISQLSSSTARASIKKAQSHLSAALRLDKKR